VDTKQELRTRGLWIVSLFLLLAMSLSESAHALETYDSVRAKGYLPTKKGHLCWYIPDSDKQKGLDQNHLSSYVVSRIPNSCGGVSYHVQTYARATCIRSSDNVSWPVTVLCPPKDDGTPRTAGECFDYESKEPNADQFDSWKEFATNWGGVRLKDGVLIQSSKIPLGEPRAQTAEAVPTNSVVMAHPGLPLVIESKPSTTESTGKKKSRRPSLYDDRP